MVNMATSWSNANWDAYPLANKIEAFNLALANMDVAVMLRIERFRNPFFTGVNAGDVLHGMAFNSSMAMRRSTCSRRYKAS